MEPGSIAERFRDRSILITGSTGFLAKMLVEKILRIQPDVRKLYLLVRAPDAAAAKERLLTEVVGKGLFDVLREQHGASFHSFIKEKVCPLPGDITHQNFGLGNSEILRLSQDVDIIVNGAATTNFMERYDVALVTNTAAVIHLCQFAKQSDNLKMLLHVSTGEAYHKHKVLETALST
uniref:Fatty acyl-CoA reductase n=1 Tax=Oryza rufipogon TaxID=4529 RepID=A0A0E0P7R3_ORYRU